MKTTWTLVLVCIGLMAGGLRAADAPARMLSHDVYFTLKDKSDAGAQRLIQACRKYLSDHPGTVWFDAGVLAKELAREVNDREFDVALHILFKDKASHEQYQKAEKHLQFIEENQESWSKVRVFDSWIVVTAHSQSGIGDR